MNHSKIGVLGEIALYTISGYYVMKTGYQHALNVPDLQMAVMQEIIDLEKPNDKKRLQFKYKRIYSKKYRIDDSDDVMMTARSQVITAVNDLLRWERRLLDKLKEPVWV